MRKLGFTCKRAIPASRPARGTSLRTPHPGSSPSEGLKDLQIDSSLSGLIQRSTRPFGLRADIAGESPTLKSLQIELSAKTTERLPQWEGLEGARCRQLPQQSRRQFNQ